MWGSNFRELVVSHKPLAPSDGDVREYSLWVTLLLTNNAINTKSQSSIEQWGIRHGQGSRGWPLLSLLIYSNCMQNVYIEKFLRFRALQWCLICWNLWLGRGDKFFLWFPSDGQWGWSKLLSVLRFIANLVHTYIITGLVLYTINSKRSNFLARSFEFPFPCHENDVNNFRESTTNVNRSNMALGN